MKVVFLDVDGVLNCRKTYIERRKIYDKTGLWDLEFNPNKVLLLKKIIDATNAVIVLSSTIRGSLVKIDNKFVPIDYKTASFLELMEHFGLAIYDITPFDKNRFRQNEIHEWLNNHDDVESFVVIDDESYGLEDFVDKELVKTSFAHGGLKKKHVEKAIEILNKNDKKKVKKR